MNNGLNYQFLGGAEEVGRLSMLLETEDDTRFLFEYGMSPGDPPEYPLPAPPIDTVFLSHAHLDHSGMIPWLFSHFDQNILTTKLSGEISNLLHNDSVKIAKQEGYVIPFNRKEIKQANRSIDPVRPGQKRKISTNYDVVFHDAGHIPGSLMFELRGDRKILFTGDFNIADTHLVNGVKPVDCDTMFLESTYAGREHPKKRGELEKDLINKIDEVVNRGGVAVLPAFSVARSQELLLILRKAGFDIWFDGMGKKVSKIFLKHPKYLKSPDKLRDILNKTNFVYSNHGRKLALKSEVIITSSGMMDGGPVLRYMKDLKDDPKNAVLLTGYQVEGTNSRLLVDKKQLDFYGVREKVECEVQYYDFSAHAGHSEIIEYAKKCNPENIVLMHGDNREELVEPLSDFAEVHTPKKGEAASL
ncbi:MAG: MBL fold metallo-hydrolase [Candidatus Thermoplasmatota archaeon]